MEIAAELLLSATGILTDLIAIVSQDIFN